MSDDEPEPPNKRRYRLLENEEYGAQFEARVEQALDEALGPSRRRPPPPSHWPELSDRISDAAFMHELEPEEHALEKIDRFEALATVGAGGFGTVFKVRDPGLDRIVALKLCSASLPGAEQALLEEAKILANIKHSNIITVHEIGHYEGAMFLVTEYVNACSMYEYAVDDDEPLRWEVVVDLFIGVGEILADAHEAKVVHGDLKPENILVDPATRTTYLVDFGLARHMSPTPVQLVSERGGLGTPPYMAPEQLRGALGDRLSDQYAFAVSLWQCIEGRVPYMGDGEGLLEAIAYGEPMRWRQDVPERVYAVVRKGFSEQREDRYADMRAFVRALALARGPRPVPKSVDDEVEVSPSEEAPKSLGKKGAVFGIALLIAAAGMFGELYAHRGQSEPDQSQQEPREARATAAVRGYGRAAKLLRAGDVRGCYEKWREAATLMNAYDANLAGELSLLLASDIAAIHPKGTAAAWIAVGAAESFDEAKDSERAKDARERAAEFYENADAPDPAVDPARNAGDQLDGYSSQPTVPSGNE